MANIQYFHEVVTAADQERFDEEHAQQSTRSEQTSTDNDDLAVPATRARYSWADRMTETLLHQMKQDDERMEGDRFSYDALACAKDARLFDHIQSTWQFRREAVSNATDADLEQLQYWKAEMDTDIGNINSLVSMQPPPSEYTGQVVLEAESHATVLPIEAQPSDTEQIPVTVDPSILRPDQRRAYDIVERHLAQTLRGENHEPLRLLLHGEGGTGKSKVIQTITELFRSKGIEHWLMRAAYTGVAASLIEGKTTHTIGQIGRGHGKPMSEETLQRMALFWQHIDYLILDECSMLRKWFLAALSKNITAGRERAGKARMGYSFGGLNILLAGDFHQFPPVACPHQETLYIPRKGNEEVLTQIGGMIYHEFEQVVILKEQMRVRDAAWQGFLKHLRDGRVDEQDLCMLDSLLVKTNRPNVNEGGWVNAVLVTSRHSVRTQWNKAAIRQHCQRTGQVMYISNARDTRNGKELTLMEKFSLVDRSLNPRKKKSNRNDLPERIELAIGMKVMVTQNVQTDLDITNGARGTIVDIKLDPEEPIHPTSHEVHLVYPPAYILVKLDRTRACTLSGLENSVIPVEPRTLTYNARFLQENNTIISKSVQRRQLPLTVAYAFTDYRSQGQTMESVIVDLAPPPGPKLNIFNIYVVLLRSQGRESIRLLRPYRSRDIIQTPPLDLIIEDDRLDQLNKVTKQIYENGEINR